MKNWFLQFQLNKLAKNNKERKNIPFDKANKFGLLFDSIEHYNKSKPLIEELTKLGKHCSILVQVPYKKDQKYPFPFFTNREVNIFGKVNSENLLHFSKDKFDFLFYFGKNSTKLIDFILLKTNAKCRVGFHKENQESFFELMFSSTMYELDILKHIQGIKVNE